MTPQHLVQNQQMTMHAPNLGEILLVDNVPQNLAMLVECFSAYGFELTVVHDSETAFQHIQLAPPDLILLDIMIPGIGGLETCRRLKDCQETKDIPIIFIKAQEDIISLINGFSVGAADFINKPLQIEEVLARVTAHLKIRNLQKQLEDTIATLEQEIRERKRAEDIANEAKHHTQQANECMRRDLEAAARVQQSLLPDASPSISGVSFAWTYQPCAELGGDSLNIFSLGEHHVGMYVLDVTGHGVPASLLSVTLSRVLIPRTDPSCLFTQSDNGSLASPAEVATRLNHMFPMNKGGNQYFTLLYGILDTQHQVFRYVCAGHPPPILHVRGQQPVICEARSLPIGLFENEHYEDCAISLEPGSRVYLYSDGLLEAMNPKREIFGESRLERIISSNQKLTLNDSIAAIETSVSNWTETGQVHDDLSLLAFELDDTLKRSS